VLLEAEIKLVAQHSKVRPRTSSEISCHMTAFAHAY